MADNSIYQKDLSGVEKVQRAWDISDQYMEQKFRQWERMDQLYRGHQDLSNRDPYLAYPKSSMPFSMIESQTARDVNAVFSSSPWVPLTSTLLENRAQSKHFESAFQCLAELGSFKEQMYRAAKMRRLNGLSYVEVTPRWDEIEIMQERAITTQGIVTDIEKVPQKVRRFRLDFHAFAPYEVYRDPFAANLEDSRWVIKMFVSSKHELKKMAEAGKFGDNFDVDKLDSDAASSGSDITEAWSHKIRESLHLSGAEADSDIGIYLEFESPEEYIKIWDFRVELSRGPNPYKHGKVNLTALINNFDPNPAMAFDGIPELKPVESTISMLDSSLGQLVNNANASQHKVLLFRKDSVSPDQLRMTAHNRIQISNLPASSPLNSAVEELRVTPLGPDYYNLPAKLESMIRGGLGIFEQDEGSAGTSQTATGDALRRQQSDSRKKMTIDLYLLQVTRIADLGFSHMDQFMDTDDWAALIGEEAANEMEVTHPNHIAGGCIYSHVGADKASQNLIDTRELIDSMSVLTQVTNPVLRRKYFELKQWTPNDIEEYERFEAEAQQQAAQQAQQQADNEIENFTEKKQITARVDIEKQVVEVGMGLKSLPGDQTTKPATQAKAKKGA